MPHLQEAIVDAVKGWPVQPQVVIGEQEKRAAFRIAHAALAKSGTVTLELALSGVPMVTAYRTGSVEAWILRRAIKVNSVILANLVIGENVVPEFLQEGLHAGKTRAGAARGARRFRVAAQAGRGVREDRLHHVDRQSATKRSRRRYRAGDDAEGAAGVGCRAAKPPGRANARPMTGSCVPTIGTPKEKWWARRKRAFAPPCGTKSKSRMRRSHPAFLSV
jgi:hypothetical protein